jgi:hypothetical protein
VATLDVWPETGRTRQIRRHCVEAGMPIVGDIQESGGLAHLQVGCTHIQRVDLGDTCSSCIFR